MVLNSLEPCTSKDAPTSPIAFVSMKVSGISSLLLFQNWQLYTKLTMEEKSRAWILENKFCKISVGCYPCKMHALLEDLVRSCDCLVWVNPLCHKLEVCRCNKYCIPKIYRVKLIVAASLSTIIYIMPQMQSVRSFGKTNYGKCQILSNTDIRGSFCIDVALFGS